MQNKMWSGDAAGFYKDMTGLNLFFIEGWKGMHAGVHECVHVCVSECVRVCVKVWWLTKQSVSLGP